MLNKSSAPKKNDNQKRLSSVESTDFGNAHQSSLGTEPDGGQKDAGTIDVQRLTPNQIFHLQSIVGNQFLLRQLAKSEQRLQRVETKLVPARGSVNDQSGSDNSSKGLEEDEFSESLDYYLRLFRDAGDADVQKKLYRRLALKLHPDKNTERDTTAAFKAMSMAYQRVSAPAAKAEGGEMPELQGEPAALGDSIYEDLMVFLFDGDSAKTLTFMDGIGRDQATVVYNSFGGPRGLPAVGQILSDLCEGDAGQFVQLVKAFGSIQNVRRAYLRYDGNTKKLALTRSHFGSFEHFAQALEGVRYNEETLDKQLEDERANKGIKDVATVGKAEKISYRPAKDVLRDWLVLSNELAVLAMTDTPDKSALAQYVERLNTLIGRIDDVVNRMRGKILGSVRYSDSIKKMNETRPLRVRSRDELGKQCEGLSGKMPFAEQRMIPGVGDMEAIKEKMKVIGPTATPSQGWALAGAEMKGTSELAFNRTKAVQRLEQFNGEWGTNYTVDDLDTILYHLSKLPIATNYFLSSSPGANTGSNVSKRPLVELLMQDDRLRNVWETGASQASTSESKRGAVEEQMGYSAALNRTDGTFQDINANNTFDPKKRGEMPKYAALVSPSQTGGVAGRYGTSYVVMKESVRERITHTPGDSWNLADAQGVKYFTSNKHPEVIFANGDANIMRLAAAEATGKDAKWLSDIRKRGADFGGPYIETQIHGDLLWDDVDEVVIGYGKVVKQGEIVIEDTTREDAVFLAERLREFANVRGLKLKVTLKDERKPDFPQPGPSVRLGGYRSPSGGTGPGKSASAPESAKEEEGIRTENGYFIAPAQAAALRRDQLANVDVAPDGDCLFNSLIHVGAYRGNARAFRTWVADAIDRGDIGDISGFGTEEHRVSNAIIADEIRRLGSYNNLAGDMTSQIIAQLLQATIIIYNENGSTTRLDGGGNVYRIIRFTNPARHFHATTSTNQALI
jgi:curved DNA-binding protein CbpA